MPASSAPLADRAAARLRRRVSRGARPYRPGSYASPGRRPAFLRAPPSQADPRTGRSRVPLWTEAGVAGGSSRALAALNNPARLAAGFRIRRPTQQCIDLLATHLWLDDPQKRQPARRNNALHRRDVRERRILDGAEFGRRRYRYARTPVAWRGAGRVYPRYRIGARGAAPRRPGAPLRAGESTNAPGARCCHGRVPTRPWVLLCVTASPART
jgi:hypothetical protein